MKPLNHRTVVEDNCPSSESSQCSYISRGHLCTKNALSFQPRQTQAMVDKAQYAGLFGVGMPCSAKTHYDPEMCPFSKGQNSEAVLPVSTLI